MYEELTAGFREAFKAQIQELMTEVIVEVMDEVTEGFFTDWDPEYEEEDLEDRIAHDQFTSQARRFTYDWDQQIWYDVNNPETLYYTLEELAQDFHEVVPASNSPWDDENTEIPRMVYNRITGETLELQWDSETEKWTSDAGETSEGTRFITDKSDTYDSLLEFSGSWSCEFSEGILQEV